MREVIEYNSKVKQKTKSKLLIKNMLVDIKMGDLRIGCPNKVHLYAFLVEKNRERARFLQLDNWSQN